MRKLAKNPSRWYLYVVRTVEGYLYTGITTDVSRRFAEHVSGGRKSAKYLRAHPPRELVFSVKIGSHADALRAEYRFKQLTKPQKERIVARKPMPAKPGRTNFITLS